MSTDDKYSALCTKLKDISVLDGVMGLLGWDEQTMMPDGAADIRGRQKSLLAGIAHEKRTDPSLGTLLAALTASSPTSSTDKDDDRIRAAVLRDAARDYKKATAIPTELAKAIAQHESDAYHAWVAARKASDFSHFAPYLSTWIDLLKKKASLIDSKARTYDVLLDEYERGTRSDRIASILQQVADALVPLIAAIRQRGVPPSTRLLDSVEWNVEQQAVMCKEIAMEIGFNDKMGRLDVSVHPFTGGAHPQDVRMTTRYKSNDMLEGLTGTVHETGHALYEQGRNAAWDGLPTSAALSMGSHESQSLLWERMVGLSRPFVDYLLTKIHKFFPDKYDAMLQQCDGSTQKLGDALYGAMNVFKTPSLIRVEADEVQYPLHIVLRFELEQGLFDGTISIDQVPTVWNERMEALLGATVPSHAEGCLQDVHWSCGAVGYFPSYLLGAATAVQLYEAAKKDMPALEEQIARESLRPCANGSGSACTRWGRCTRRWMSCWCMQRARSSMCRSLFII